MLVLKIRQDDSAGQRDIFRVRFRQRLMPCVQHTQQKDLQRGISAEQTARQIGKHGFPFAERHAILFPAAHGLRREKRAHRLDAFHRGHIVESRHGEDSVLVIDLVRAHGVRIHGIIQQHAVESRLPAVFRECFSAGTLMFLRIPAPTDASLHRTGQAIEAVLRGDLPMLLKRPVLKDGEHFR